KVSTIAIVDERPAEVFRQLYLLEKALRFKAAADPHESAVDQSVKQDSEVLSANPTEARTEQSVPDPQRSLSHSGFDDDEDHPLELDFVPYDPSSLEERHRDDWLQTNSSPEALDKSL